VTFLLEAYPRRFLSTETWGWCPLNALTIEQRCTAQCSATS